MSGTIGKPYRFFYTAKNFQSGLMNVVAKVMKPSGALVGLFPLIELSDSYFSGAYYFDFTTNNSDTEGEYLISVKEPTANFRAISKVEFRKEGGGSGGGACKTDLKGLVQDGTILKGIVGKLDVELTGTVRGKIVQNQINGVILWP